MDADRFESFLRSLSASLSRRSALGLLTGILLGGSFTLRADDAEAHNKLKKCKKIDDKDKRKQCLKKAKRHQAKHAQESAPPPPTPVPVLTYQCPGPVADFMSPSDHDTRFAQTFTALNSGSLHQIQFGIDDTAGTTGDYLVELLAVGADGKPTNTVLATATIPDASLPEGFSRLTASFSGPPLVAGTEYATALSRLGGDGWLVDTTDTDACLGSAFFQDASGTGSFSDSGFDLITSVTVLA